MAESLDEYPWHLLQIEDRTFLAKCYVIGSVCELLVCDCNTCWYEKLIKTNVMEENARLNPNIEASYDRLLRHIVAVFNRTDPKSTLKIITNGNSDEELRITADSHLCGLAFSWEFSLVKSIDDTISNHLTKPLISMVFELHRRQKELFKIIGNKDAQIEDYKAEGVKLNRRHKDEERFDEKVFQEESTKSGEFYGLETMRNEETSFQALYTCVMKRKREHDEIRTQQSCNMDETKVGVKEETSKSPPKLARKNLEEHNQDKELERRLALETRLAEERIKKEIQSKKKKLKL